ncbi:MAG: class I SAM-dependent methyltransferase [Deltaproteobacteria bacterium]|nr:class I SAM-dependent methyltransferase [Deltaproteobacteria bacterium]
MFDIPQPFRAQQFKLYRQGISDDSSIDVYINEQEDFAFLHPPPKMNYQNYTPRVAKFGLQEYKKNLDLLERRFNKISQAIEDGRHSLLEVGAGDGLFLKTVRSYLPALHLTAMDKDQNTLQSRVQNSDENYNSLEEIIEKNKHYDFICLFHVLEHVEKPLEFLTTIKKAMSGQGTLIIEVPSLLDPMLSLYNCEAYSSFYFSSQHPYVYSPDSLQHLMEQCDFQTKEVITFQRYGLENHLNWLSQGRPGGNEVYRQLFRNLESDYIADLEQCGKTDTVIWLGQRTEK